MESERSCVGVAGVLGEEERLDGSALPSAAVEVQAAAVEVVDALEQPCLEVAVVVDASVVDPSG